VYRGIWVPRFCGFRGCMGWLRLVGSLKLYVSFAKEHYKRAYILQKDSVCVCVPRNLSPSIWWISGVWQFLWNLSLKCCLHVCRFYMHHDDAYRNDLYMISHIFSWFYIYSHDFTYIHMTSHIFTWFHIYSHDFTYIHMYVAHMHESWRVRERGGKKL